jgi:hypothetical protein
VQGHLFLSTLDWAAVEEKSGEAPYKPEAPAPVNTDDRTWCDGVPGEIQPAAPAKGAGGGGGGGKRRPDTRWKTKKQNKKKLTMLNR